MEPKYGGNNLKPTDNLKMIKNPELIYEDLGEEFLDNVFGHECKLHRNEWVAEVKAN